jgi:PHD/YefM family antitoxin component YafN of YafNO toxin-antitoxin module
MLTLDPQYITDKSGKKVSVIIPVKEFKTILEGLEELEDIRRYDKVKKSKEPSIPAVKAFKMIESKRKRKA